MSIAERGWFNALRLGLDAVRRPYIPQEPCERPTESHGKSADGHGQSVRVHA